MRNPDKYMWNRPEPVLRVPRESRVNWGPLVGIVLIILTGIAFWSAVYHWVKP